MLNIQSAMLALLGFLVATLLVLLLGPAYRRRTVRLTTERIKREMPLTEAEIRADKDRLRAEYAIKVHHLEVKAEQAAHDSARQQIELNRRDAAISQLEVEIGRLKSSLEEHENARRVLEQTITDRFPGVEARLSETARMLGQRDRELAGLRETAARQAKALEEAAQQAAQQRDELMRLNNTLAAMSARSRDNLNDPKLAAEVALRTELDALRARLLQQTALVEQLQAGANGVAASPGAVAALMTSSLPMEPSEAENALALARTEAETIQKAKAEVDEQLAASRRTIEDQAVELARLKAALTAYESGGNEERSVSLKDSRIAMKARIGALQAESQHQSAAITRMRTELAAANEKLAKQAAHFMAELRRLGPGGAGVGAQAKPASDVRRAAVESAGAQLRRVGPALADLAKPLRSVAGAAAEVTRPSSGEMTAQEAQDPSRVRGFLKALGGAAAARAGAGDAGGADVRPVAPEEVLAAGAGAGHGAAGAPPARRLVDRISSVTKSS